MMIPHIEPGDKLLYSGTSAYSRAIKLKTGSDVSHIETYIGEGYTAGSREKVGVRTFEYSPTNLAYILRPKPEFPYNFQAGLDWHKTVIGQGYDYIGLLAFWYASWRGDDYKQFCSEHAGRFDNKTG